MDCTVCSIGIYHCNHPNDTNVSSCWCRRYSSLVCMSIPEIAWALPCSACNKHLPVYFIKGVGKHMSCLMKERARYLSPRCVSDMWSCARHHLVAIHKHAYRFKRKRLLLRQVNDVLLPDHRLCTCVARNIQLRLVRELLPLHLIILVGLHMSALSAECQSSAMHKNCF